MRHVWFWKWGHTLLGCRKSSAVAGTSPGFFFDNFPVVLFVELHIYNTVVIAARGENRALLHDSYDEILRRENEFVPVAHSRSPYSYSTSWRSMSACLFFRSNRSSR